MAFSDTFTALGNTIINLVNTRLKKDFSNIETAGEDKIKELSTYTVDGVPYTPGEYSNNLQFTPTLFGMCPLDIHSYTDLSQYFFQSTTVPEYIKEIGQRIDLSNITSPAIDRISIGSALDSIVNNIIGTNTGSLPYSTVYGSIEYMINDMYGYWSNYRDLVDNSDTVTLCVTANIGKRSNFTWDYFTVESYTTLWEYAKMVDGDLNSVQQAFDSVIQQLEEAANSTGLPNDWEGDDGEHTGSDKGGYSGGGNPGYDGGGVQ